MATQKFIVSSSALLQAVKEVSATIVNNPVVPALENVLFVLARDGSLSNLFVYGSDMEVELRASLAVEAAIDSEDWQLCVPARLLQQGLSALPDQPVTITVDLNTYAVEVKASRSRFKMAGERGSDFPRFKDSGKARELTVPAATLRAMFGATVPFTSTDTLRPAMTSVYVNCHDNRLTMASTNGHLLSEVKVTTAGDAQFSGTVLVPSKAGKLLLKLIQNQEYSGALELGTNWMRLSVGRLMLRCRLVDERYPDYQNIIPVSNPSTLRIGRDELLAGIKEVAAFANKVSHQVRFDLGADHGTMRVSAFDLDFSTEGETRVNGLYDGEEMVIAFNARYAQELLALGMPAGELVAGFSTPNRAMVIEPAEKEESGIERKVILMPVVLDNYI